MRTIRRLIYREVLGAVLFVAVGFLALFFFFDFVDDLSNVGKAGGAYRLTQALAYVTLLRNGGPIVQAWPQLELTLTDANDQPLLRRVIAPAD